MTNDLTPELNTTDIFASLSPSNQRLVRELILKLAPSIPTTPFDYSSAIPSWIFHLTATGKSASVLRCYPLHVRLLLAEYPTPTLADIEIYITRLLSSGQLPATINLKLTAFRSLGEYCLENSLIESNPFSKLKTLKLPLRERVCPPPSDVLRLISQPLSTRDKAILYTFIDTGIRLSEFLTLRINDILPDSIRVIGKGDKQRSIPTSIPCRLSLLAHLSTLPPGTLYAFPGRFYNHPLHFTAVEDILKRLCFQCGIPTLTPHQLRHYFATQMLNSGASLKIVSLLLGHSSPAITARIYWHVDAGVHKTEHDKFGPLTQLVGGLQDAP